MKIRALLKMCPILAGCLFALSGCGGSNSVSQSDALPVGSTLSVIMALPETATNAGLFQAGGFICYVQATNVGYMNYYSLELTQPNAFSYTRNGRYANFETSFVVKTGSYIAAGPTTVTEEGYVSIALVLDLGAEPERAFLNDFTGTCTYKQSFIPVDESTVPTSLSEGSGTFKLTLGGTASDISTTVTSTTTSSSS